MKIIFAKITVSTFTEQRPAFISIHKKTCSQKGLKTFDYQGTTGASIIPVVHKRRLKRLRGLLSVCTAKSEVFITHFWLYRTALAHSNLVWVTYFPRQFLFKMHSKAIEKQDFARFLSQSQFSHAMLWKKNPFRNVIQLTWQPWHKLSER